MIYTYRDGKRNRSCVNLCLNLISSIQSLSHVQLFVTRWTAACQASLSIINSRSLLKLMSIESMMPSNHLMAIKIFGDIQLSVPCPEFSFSNLKQKPKSSPCLSS